MKKTSILFSGASAAAISLSMATGAAAQDDVERIRSADEIVVQGTIGYRNRTDATAPTLEYGEDYFQRFEPLTAGDALKRVPSVTFLSDVIESDGARLRGLDPSYTQILINGEKVPGSQVDRSFFVDRIPAELIERVEIVRSSSARRSGDAVAGTLNIVLRDGYELDGGYVRFGGLRFNDGEVKPSVGGVYGGQFGPGRILLGGNFQGRYNPKLKDSLRFDDSPENNPNFFTEEFKDREDQVDTRDGRDYSFNADYTIQNDDEEFSVSGFIVYTDRDEFERSFEYFDPTALTGPLPDGDLFKDDSNVNFIEQLSYSTTARYSKKWSLGETKFRVGYASFDDEQTEYQEVVDFEDAPPPVFEGEFVTVDIEDTELFGEISHQYEVTSDIDVEIGAFYQAKDRDTLLTEAEEEFDLVGLTGYNQFRDRPEQFSIGYTDFEPIDGGDSKIDENRLDFFAVAEGQIDRIRWEAGIRYESTDVTVFDRVDNVTVENDYDYFLPSAHLRYDITAKDRVNVSAARTVRRPGFDFISPAFLGGEFEDDDFVGVPGLSPETAWGFDVGYERRIGENGVVGINFFYRDVTDLIELTNTGLPSETYCEDFEDDTGFSCDDVTAGVPGAADDFDPDSFLLTPTNTGNGTVYGVEFDLSTPLSFINLPNTGLFANVSWLESEIDDFAGERRFNGQSNYVYNVGFIHDIPSSGTAFGVTYRKQGDAFDRLPGEEVTTSYGADLEVFGEQRFGDSFTARFVASNLLNASKDEVFNKFDNQIDQAARDFDEFELETESAGPVFQVMMRYAF